MGPGDTEVLVCRPELEDLPRRMAKLPRDDRGYPVPWFVAWVDGPNGPETVPEFRAMDARKWKQAVKLKLCWVCGEPLGTYKAFVIGPMCAVNRTTSEPPCHTECAEWSARNCPFLSNPDATRRDHGLPSDVEEPGGTMIPRNPGVTLIWIAKDYTVFDAGGGKALIHLGAAVRVSWWCQGRTATRAEVDASVASGLPALEAVARSEGALPELRKAILAAERWYPTLRESEGDADPQGASI